MMNPVTYNTDFKTYWFNNDLSVMGVINNYLIEFKSIIVRWNPHLPDTGNGDKALIVERSWPYRKICYYYSAQSTQQKMSPNEISLQS